MKEGSCLFHGKKQNWQEGRSSLHTALRETVIRGFHGRITRTIQGMSFVGSIVGTQGEQVEVAFDIDKTAAGGNRYGFAPATGNLMYCMPQKGTKTALYIGNGDEAQGNSDRVYPY